MVNMIIRYALPHQHNHRCFHLNNCHKRDNNNNNPDGDSKLEARKNVGL